jgi:formylglycine-generating enzyme required for sulfatase activity
MKSQMWLLSVSFLLMCGTIGWGEEPELVVQEHKTAANEPDTNVEKPNVAEDPRSWDEITNSIGMKLKLIPAGEFLMGSPDSDEASYVNEKPQHLVRITKPFYLCVTEVTQDQYETVMGKNPSHFKGAANPVETVTWNQAVEFCKKLSAKEGKTYRLPTEAEWEYACRAGTTTSYSFGDDAASFGEYAWFIGNAERKTHPVGEKKPNAWGLFDMHGNVFEWCQDWFGEYTADVSTDPVGPSEATTRVSRGGCWYFSARHGRSAFRSRSTPDGLSFILGFRVAAVPSS